MFGAWTFPFEVFSSACDLFSLHRKLHHLAFLSVYFGFHPIGEAHLERRRTVLALVARLAGEREVRGPVAAAARPGLDMLDLERDVFRIAVGAFAVPLLEQICLPGPQQSAPGLRPQRQLPGMRPCLRRFPDNQQRPKVLFESFSWHSL